MKLRKFIVTALVLSLILCAMLMTVSAADVVFSGKCGDNVTWTLDSDDTLTISGSGNMYNYDYDNDYDYDDYAYPAPWYSYRNTIRNVVIKDGVTSIGEYAFYKCSKLTSVTIPNSVTNIGGFSFNYCSSLTGINLPDNITKISHDTFSGCTSLKNIIIPDSVTVIGSYAFYNCSSLTNVTLPDRLTAINERAFYHCSSLTGINLPDNITKISYETFRDCTSLKNIIIPDSVTVIGSNAFYNCSSLTSVTLPDRLTTINDRAFYHCSSLTSITIPDSVTSIGGFAFEGCSSLTSITIPDNITKISRNTFSGCTSLKYIIIPDSVTVIGLYAFNGCSGLTSVLLPDSITAIVDRAFYNCNSLTEVQYTGSPEQWNAISISSGNNPIKKATRHYGPVVECVQIVTQPKTSYFKMGDEVVMSVVAEGFGLNYEWYYNMNAGVGDFIKDSVTGPTYRTTMNASTKDRMVRCVITDAFGNSVTSNQVTMRLAATITEQPTDVHVAAGKMATVQLTAVGDGLTYTWYQAPAGSSTFTKSTTFTGNTYQVEMDASRDGRQVYCVVKDRYGKTHKSDVVTINMIKPPVITTQPKTNYTKQGDTATMTIEAEGDGLTYTWYYMNAGTDTFKKSAVTGPVYSTTMNSSVKNRMVYCIVTNEHGASIKSNQVTMRMAATITKQPVNASAAVGKKVSVKLSAVGDGLTYTWYYKNAGATKFSKSSVTSSTYSTTMNTTVDGRQIYCVVKDWYGKTHKSDTVTIGITAKITKQPTTGYAANGSTVKVSTKASGDGLTYTWYYKNAGATTYSKSSLTSATYSTTMNPTVRNRQVYCVIRDMYGNELKTDTVTLRMTASITTQPKDTIAASGRKVSTKVSALGDGLTYTWYYKNAGATKFVKSSLTSATYSTTMNSTVDRRQVYCVVTDKYGYSVKSSTATLYME